MTLEELNEAANSLKNNISPVIDSVTNGAIKIIRSAAPTGDLAADLQQVHRKNTNQ